MKAWAIVASTALVVASSSVHAEERTWIGAALGLQNQPPEMLGAAPEIVDGLGLSHEPRSGVRFMPHLSLQRDLYTGDEHTFGVECSVRWFADSITATSPIAYRARRDVVPVSVLARLAFGGKTSRLVLGAGPTIAMSRFDESGWLGDGTRTKAAFGGTFSLGGQTQLSADVRFTYLVFVEYLRLPTKNVLLADGGDTWMLGTTVGLDLGF
jgi:hypothetical protein